MRSQTWTKRSTILAVLLVLLFGHSDLIAKKKKQKQVPVGTPVLWREPTDIASRDLYLGPGGEEMKPDLNQVTFISDETRGYSKRFRLRDGAGREWIAKMGAEAQPDTVASRLLWAVGYFTDSTYLATTVEIQGKGVFQNVEFKARPKEVKRYHDWDWEKNPFAGTKELQGLRILMVLLNNWDLKNTNNRILVDKGDGADTRELRYMVSDLGATFGKTGNFISHDRNRPAEYEKTKFVNKVEGNVVSFDYHGKDSRMLRNISVADAKWLGGLLSQLSDKQISDAFRAANHSQEDIQSRLLRQFVRG